MVLQFRGHTCFLLKGPGFSSFHLASQMIMETGKGSEFGKPPLQSLVMEGIGLHSLRKTGCSEGNFELEWGGWSH